jgi:hypothetical protein
VETNGKLTAVETTDKKVNAWNQIDDADFFSTKK